LAPRAEQSPVRLVGAQGRVGGRPADIVVDALAIVRRKLRKIGLKRLDLINDDQRVSHDRVEVRAVDASRIIDVIIGQADLLRRTFIQPAGERDRPESMKRANRSPKSAPACN
jgi:hypothetical protein